MKRGRRIFLILAACGAAGLIIALAWPQEREPVYQGKRLSEWLIAYADNRYANPALADQAADAVHHIGTNALPLLVGWMNYEMPQWRGKLADVVLPAAGPLGGRRLLNTIAGAREVRASAALTGFEILGQKAAPAVPALTRLLGHWESPSVSRSTLLALMYVGKDGLPPLVAVVTNRSVPIWFRCNAAERIGAPVMCLGTNGSWAVPILMRCLDDDKVAGAVAQALGNLKAEPGLTVPALAGGLRAKDLVTRINAAESLGRLGREAAAAVPDLLAATSSTDSLVREAATNALRKIAPEVLGGAAER